MRQLRHVRQALVGTRRIPVQQGLNMWLRADAETLPDGTGMSFVRDFSGAGNHCLQATATSRPVYCKYGGVDGLPFISYDQTQATTVMSCAGYQTNLQSFSALWIGDLQNVDATKYLINVGSINAVIMVDSGAAKIFPGSVGTMKPFSGRRIAIVYVSGPGGRALYLDDINSVTTTTAASASTVSSIAFGDSGGKYYGRFYEAALYNRPLSVPEVAQLLAYAKYYYGTGLSQLTPTGRLVAEGDSTVFGLGTTRNRSGLYYLNPAKDWYVYSHGVSGQQITSMSTDQSEPNVWAAAGNWLFFEGGYNDLGASVTGATVESRISTYLNAAITAGFPKSQIILMTLSTAGTTTERDNLNTLLRANYTGYAGWLVDQAADANLGVNTGSGLKDSSYFADGTHMNDKGYIAKAALIRSTIGGSLPF